MLRAMLKADGLRKSFGTTRAVDGISFCVNRGEVVGLLGPNGAGKSTTIALCTGLAAPDSGAVLIGDDGTNGPPSDSDQRRQIGIAPQQIALYDNLTASENLIFLGEVYGIASAGSHARALELLELIDLLPRAHDRVRTFSGGMKRRLNLAAALVHDPPLVLLDEPTAGVDPQSRIAILELAANLARDGRAVVYTTHYLEEAERVCSRALVMDHGRVLADGSIPELRGSHESLEAAFFSLTGRSVRD